MATTTKLTVNGVEIEIEGQAEVSVDGGKVKIVVGGKTVVENHTYLSPWPRTYRIEPHITWGTTTNPAPDFKPSFPTITCGGTGVVND